MTAEAPISHSLQGLLQDRKEKDRLLVQGIVDHSLDQVEIWRQIPRIAFEAYAATIPPESSDRLVAAYTKNLWTSLPSIGYEGAAGYISGIDLQTGAILQLFTNTSEKDRTYSIPLFDFPEERDAFEQRISEMPWTTSLAPDRLILRYAYDGNERYLDASIILEELKAEARKKFGPRFQKHIPVHSSRIEHQARMDTIRNRYGFSKATSRELS